MSESFLTPDDVEQLLRDPSPDNRQRTAEHVATQFQAGVLSPSERQLAEEIFRIMMRDAEVRVREALSRHLKESRTLPRDVALALARDVDSVALPMLECSDVLTDADLIAIVRSSGVAKQVAVAQRSMVSASVSEALVETGDETVVSALVANVRADIPEDRLAAVVDQFAGSEAVQTNMLRRPDLPLTVAERLVARASDSLRKQLMAPSALSEVTATEIIVQARERAVLGLLGDNVRDDDVEVMVRHIQEQGRLTPSLVLRALVMGDQAFFETAMARLAGVPVINARTLIYDAGPLGLRAIFDKAGLPEAFFPATRAAADVGRAIQLDGQPHDRERRSRKIMERVLTQYGDLGVTFEAADLDYLLTRLGQLT
jgi:uncharacterized protein (DUF2336 family)